MSAEIVNFQPISMSFTCEIKLKMKNPLKSATFDRFDATKDRSPRFRAFVIFILLLVSFFLVYVVSSKKILAGSSKEILPKPATTMSK